jgi:hypothetical protein
MGNTCCQGRPPHSEESAEPSDFKHKHTVPKRNNTLKHSGTKNFTKRKNTSPDRVGHKEHKMMSLKSSPDVSIREKEAEPPHSGLLVQTKEAAPEIQAPFATLPPFHYELTLGPTDPQTTVEESKEEEEVLEYTLKTAYNCSATQRKQILELFENNKNGNEEELDGFAEVTALSKGQAQPHTLLITNLALYLVDQQNFLALQRRVKLDHLAALGLTYVRDSLVLVIDKQLCKDQNLVLMSAQVEDILKALETVYYENKSMYLPAYSMDSLETIQEWSNGLTTGQIAESRKPEMRRITWLFVTKGEIGENKLLFVKCTKELNGQDTPVTMLLSNKAIYTLSAGSLKVIAKLSLRKVDGVSTEGEAIVVTTEESEQRWKLASSYLDVFQSALEAEKLRYHLIP